MAVGPPAIPPVIRARPAPVPRRRSPVVNAILAVLLVAILVALIIFFTYCAACFDAGFNGGQWLDLGAGILMITLLPLCGVLCLILALILQARGASRPLARSAMAIAVLFGCPILSFPLAKGFSAQAASILGPYKDRAETERHALEMAKVTRRNAEMEAAAARHYVTLAARFAQPQRISRVEHGLIILDDGTVLSLYGVSREADVMLRLKRGESALLSSREVLVRLPERQWFMQEYWPAPAAEPWMRGDAETFARSPTDAAGWRYGRIPCLLYLDGRLLNSQFADKSSFHTFEFYEKPPARPAG